MDDFRRATDSALTIAGRRTGAVADEPWIWMDGADDSKLEIFPDGDTSPVIDWSAKIGDGLTVLGGVAAVGGLATSGRDETSRL